MIKQKTLALASILAAGVLSAVICMGASPVRAQSAAPPPAAVNLTPVGPSLNLPVSRIPKAPYIAPPFRAVTNYYVSTKGSDTNDGTSAKSAWRTIQHACDALQAQGDSHGGVVVNVEPGTYTESIYTNHLGGSSDTPTGYLVILSTKLHGATIQTPKDNPGNCLGFDDAHYIIVDGFNLVGWKMPMAWGNGVAVDANGSPGHHVKILNNIICNQGGAGIGGCRTDYLDVEGNVIYDSVNTCQWEESGISLWEPVAFDNLAVIHNIFRDNVVYNCREASDGHQYHSDGNGIILDDFHCSQSAGKYPNYTGRSLVENNLVINSGGAGIHLYLTDGVTVRNNTVYHDYLDPLLGGNQRGEYDEVAGSNDVFINNIGVSDASANPANGAFLAVTRFGTGTGNVWKNNLTFNGKPGQDAVFVQGAPSDITAANGNILGVDPMFVDPENGDFRLKPGSPAIGAGTKVLGAPAADLNGKKRSGKPDIGAYAN